MDRPYSAGTDRDNGYLRGRGAPIFPEGEREPLLFRGQPGGFPDEGPPPMRGQYDDFPPQTRGQGGPGFPQRNESYEPPPRGDYDQRRDERYTRPGPNYDQKGSYDNRRDYDDGYRGEAYKGTREEDCDRFGREGYGGGGDRLGGFGDRGGRGYGEESFGGPHGGSGGYGGGSDRGLPSEFYPSRRDEFRPGSGGSRGYDDNTRLDFSTASRDSGFSGHVSGPRGYGDGREPQFATERDGSFGRGSSRGFREDRRPEFEGPSSFGDPRGFVEGHQHGLDFEANRDQRRYAGGLGDDGFGGRTSGFGGERKDMVGPRAAGFPDPREEGYDVASGGRPSTGSGFERGGWPDQDGYGHGGGGARNDAGFLLSGARGRGEPGCREGGQAFGKQHGDMYGEGRPGGDSRWDRAGGRNSMAGSAERSMYDEPPTGHGGAAGFGVPRGGSSTGGGGWGGGEQGRYGRSGFSSSGSGVAADSQGYSGEDRNWSSGSATDFPGKNRQGSSWLYSFS